MSQTTTDHEILTGSLRKRHALRIAVAILVLSPLLLLFGSCSSPEEEESQLPKPEETTAHYYVKYEVSFPVYGHTPTLSIHYISEKGQSYTSIAKSSWDGTFGPFEPGTTVSVTASSDLVNRSTLSSVRLLVCNGNGPFVLKAEMSKLEAKTVSASYTIQATD